MPVLKPRLEILPAAQLRLWPELSATPSHFVLYGGTALALRIGHRRSVDFDFFTSAQFDPLELMERLPYLKGAELVQSDNNTLRCRVDRGGPVLLSYFGGLTIAQVEPADLVEGPGFRVAGLRDIAGTKAMVLHRRNEAKDYIDIAALIEYGLDLPEIAAAGQTVYGDRFNVMIMLKALSYFDDVPALPQATRRTLQQAVRSFDSSKIPPLEVYNLRIGGGQS